MTRTITVSTILNTITCPNCGGIYAIAKDYQDEARKLGNFKKCWTCPYCTTERGYGRGELQNLKELLDQEKRSTEYLRRQRDNALAESDHFRRSRDGMKGALVKVKKRVGKGVCPCCNRHFSNLQAHMENKHPEYGGSLADLTE